MNRAEFAGTLAIVRPDLEDDPGFRRGQVGVVLHVGSDNSVYMEFADHADGMFQPYEVFQLKDKDFISEVKASGEEIGVQDYKDLYTIDLLQKMGRSIDHARALESAVGNVNLWNRTLDTVESKLDLTQHYAAGR